MTTPPLDYARLGPEALGDADLLSLALGDRTLATRLLDDLGGASLLGAPPGALARTLGPRRAARLHASIALTQRLLGQPPRRARVSSPQDAAAWLQSRFAGLGHEELHGLFVDRRGGVLAVRRLSQGSADHTIFDVRHILGEALRVGAAGVIVAHNHPSGDPEPSAEDLTATMRLADGAMMLGLELQDHLVFAGAGFVSLAERGQLVRPGRPPTRPPTA